MGWRWMDNLTGRMSGIDPMDQFASGYVGLGNNPVMGTDPDGQWVQYAIGAVLGGFSGYKIGKAQGATGWGLASYIFSGAAIGAISVGAGEAVLGSFSFAAQAGVSSGASIGAYSAAGAAGGFVSGAGMAGLSGGDVWQGGLNGAFWGGISGGLMGLGQHLAFSASINNMDNLIAEEYAWTNNIPEGAVVIKGKKNIHAPNYHKRAAYSGFMGLLDYYWTGGNENGYKYSRDGSVVGYAPIMGEAPVPSFGKLVKGYDFAKQIGKFYEFRKVIKASNISGQARAVYVKTINESGKTVRLFKDTFRRDGRFLHRSTKYPVIENLPKYSK
ncbi:MAG: hypothetical protein EAY79_05145 [Runella slithyformis]|nr:MAG: hypothetical protein EAY79_05145 [Runella slithyformis]